MSELDFLLDLLLTHKIPKNTQLAIKERIAVIQVQIPTRNLNPMPGPAHINEHGRVAFSGVQQSPSMAAKVAAMEAERQGLAPHSETPPSGQHLSVAPLPIPQPVASTGAAQQALNLRQQMINGALSESGGNFDKGRKSARKF